MKYLSIIVVMVLILVFSSCSPENSNSNWNSNNTTNNINNINNGVCADGILRCFNNVVQRCAEGQWINDKTCGVGGEPPVCDSNSGSPRCSDCIAGGTVCGDDNNIYSCDSAGNIGSVVSNCDSTAGEECVDVNGTASCDSPCLRAAAKKSYRGCDYWAVTTANSMLVSPFDNNFAVVIDNSNSSEVAVNIDGPAIAMSEVIPPNTIQVFQLPYTQDIKTGSYDNGLKSAIYRAANGTGGIHITTSLPVTLYQFSPYDFAINETYSYTNDASLALPVPVLSTNYLVMSRPTWSKHSGIGMGDDSLSPGFTAILATEDNTIVNVSISAKIEGGPEVPALNAGGSGQYTLNKGDVLQLITAQDFSVSSCPGSTGTDGDDDFCTGGPQYDLTGTFVSSSNPVAVWGGHNCSFVPFNAMACDHIEEMIFPMETWGKQFFVGLTKQLQPGSTESNVIRILAMNPDTHVSFNPGVENPVTLQPREYVEFIVPVGQDFEINSTEPILVGKYLMGQNYYGGSSMGDPAFGLTVPKAQYRNEYTFTTPMSYTVNYVNVIAQIPTDSQDSIILDENPIPISEFSEIGSSGWGVARIDVTATGTEGSHHISATNPNDVFGIEVYGYASYTSYLYPGGLDLEYINPIGK